MMACSLNAYVCADCKGKLFRLEASTGTAMVGPKMRPIEVQIVILHCCSCGKAISETVPALGTIIPCDCGN